MTHRDPTKCNDYGDPDVPECLGEPDPRYVMKFDDVGEAPLQWCAACGPRAHKMSDAIHEAFETDAGFAAKLEAAIDEVKPTMH